MFGIEQWPYERILSANKWYWILWVGKIFTVSRCRQWIEWDQVRNLGNRLGNRRGLVGISDENMWFVRLVSQSVVAQLFYVAGSVSHWSGRTETMQAPGRKQNVRAAAAKKISVIGLSLSGAEAFLYIVSGIRFVVRISRDQRPWWRYALYWVPF